MKIFKIFGKRSFALAVVFLMSIFTTLQSQPPPDPECDPALPICPIDDYYSVLLAVVIVFAAYKAYKRQKAFINVA